MLLHATSRLAEHGAKICSWCYRRRLVSSEMDPNGQNQSPPVAPRTLSLQKSSDLKFRAKLSQTRVLDGRDSRFGVVETNFFLWNIGTLASMRIGQTQQRQLLFFGHRRIAKMQI